MHPTSTWSCFIRIHSCVMKCRNSHVWNVYIGKIRYMQSFARETWAQRHMVRHRRNLTDHIYANNFTVIKYFFVLWISSLLKYLSPVMQIHRFVIAISEKMLVFKSSEFMGRICDWFGFRLVFSDIKADLDAILRAEKKDREASKLWLVGTSISHIATNSSQNSDPDSAARHGATDRGFHHRNIVQSNSAKRQPTKHGPCSGQA